jgi:hypothetical protein
MFEQAHSKFLSMIIDDFDFSRAVWRPHETNPPLIIYPH